MKKIRFFLAAMVAIAGFSFVSCDKNSDEETKNNYTRYQEAVDAQINKKNDSAILLVAFGSTWDQAFNAFDETIEAYKKAFPKADVYLSYSSAICINRAAAGENTKPRNFYAPNFWLHGLGAAKYSTIVVQSLQVIPGEEFSRVVNYIKDFANNSLGDLDDEYLSKVTIKLGMPLLAAEEDVKTTAATINNVYSATAAKGVVAFMGHGNPDSYDTYKANVRYNQLEEELQKYSSNYFVGTVDAPENYKVQVLERMKEAGITSGKVYLHPLMSIAGDHAHNDMGGDDGEDMTPADYEYNDEGEIEDLSWKCFFTQNGYTCGESELIMKGLLEVESIRNLWIEHTKSAETLEDYYHSMYPEE
ncbi:MAG: sirohydrochlorin cobaltochelatase [Bacteroidaceae bacterium]|nr:sirohydrochlorin cobaltochelatase [Bacteroidaceae bacterium]